MFTVEFRESVRSKIISRAKEDERIVSAAEVGSNASGKADRWSDIDLTLGIVDSQSISEILESWTDSIAEEFSGEVLFDVQRGKTIYRVFLLPGCLQVDLSFSPEAEFGAVGKNFNLLYGRQFEKPQPKPPDMNELLGLMIHHLLRARFSAERNRFWQSEFWIGEARNYALRVACISRGLNADYGKGFDDLPEDILSMFKDSFVCGLNRKEIFKAIKAIIDALPEISEEASRFSKRFADTLKELTSP